MVSTLRAVFFEIEILIQGFDWVCPTDLCHNDGIAITTMSSSCHLHLNRK